MTFIAGQSGNTKGRTPGVPDKRTRFRRLLEPHAEELIQVLVEQAKKGDSTALRLCIERLIPRAKSEPIDISLPSELTTDAVIKLGDQILKRMAAQEIAVEEGKDLFQIIEAHMNIVGMSDLLKQYTVLSEQFRKYQEGSPLLRFNSQQEINRRYKYGT